LEGGGISYQYQIRFSNSSVPNFVLEIGLEGIWDLELVDSRSEDMSANCHSSQVRQAWDCKGGGVEAHFEFGRPEKRKDKMDE
jgi:hypothetical protein